MLYSGIDFRYSINKETAESLNKRQVQAIDGFPKGFPCPFQNKLGYQQPPFILHYSRHFRESKPIYSYEQNARGFTLRYIAIYAQKSHKMGAKPKSQ